MPPEHPTLALDLDGTLITCANRQTQLACACAAAHGVRVDASAFWAAKRQGSSTQSALAAQGVGLPVAETIAAQWSDMIETPYWLGIDRLFDDVVTTLASLKAAKWRCVLLTARARRHWLHQQLSRLRLAPYLNQVIVVPPQGAGKAKADALARLRPVGFIGDTESDLSAAVAAGTEFVALDRGQRSAEFLQGAGAPHVVHDLDAARAVLAA